MTKESFFFVREIKSSGNAAREVHQIWLVEKQ